MMRRTTFREIKNTFGRFAAIMAIIALGVGFFSGLKMTKPDMMNTMSNFLDEGNFYDLHLLSTQRAVTAWMSHTRTRAKMTGC